MRKLKTIIIDDEPFAIEGLKNLLQNNEKVIVIETFTDPNKAIELAKEADLILLDINMPTPTGFVSGIEFINSIRTKAEVIYTTGSNEFALEAYHSGAIGYLLKPISAIKLTDLINKVYNNIFYKDSSSDFNEIAESVKSIIIDDSAFRHIIKYSEILYARREGSKVYLRVIDRMITTNRKSLSGLLEDLNDDIFIRTNDNSFVNINFIEKFDSSRVYFKGYKDPSDIITVSRNQAKALWGKLDKKKHNKP